MTESTPSRRRWRPRFSLLSALLLMTIVGLTIVVLSKSVTPVSSG